MHKQFTTAVIVVSVLLGAAPAWAIFGGVPVDVEGSGFISLRTENRICTAVAIEADLFLSSAWCFPDGKVIQHPELVGWNMGTQDSDGNPIREIIIDRDQNFALIRLTSPLSVGANHWPLYRGQAADAPNVRCYGFGARGFETFPTGATLSYGDYTLTGPADRMVVSGPGLGEFDSGGACFTVSGAREIVAIIRSASEVVSTTLARAFVTEARTTFELVSTASNLCVGNVPNGAMVWQFYCAPGGNSLRINQQWLLRRLNSGGFQIRSTRFPNSCLGVQSASSLAGTRVIVSPCAPPITDINVLPSTYPPEQVWDFQNTGGDVVQIVNYLSGMCLDSPLGSSAAGELLQQSACASGTVIPTQRFVVNADRFPSGEHRLSSFADHSQCMDVNFGQFFPGAATNQWFCESPLPTSSKQQFFLSSAQGTTLQHVQRVVPGNLMCLAIPGGTTSVGAGAMQWPCGPWLDHQWQFRWTPGVYGYRLRPGHAPSLCLTRSSAGAQLTQQFCNSTGPGPAYDLQRWAVE